MMEAEFKMHLDAAEKSPREIAAAVSGLSDKVLRFKPAANKWCVLEILAHLADVEIVYGYRLRQIMADNKPVIAPIQVDDWANHLGYMDSAPAELIAFYGIARHHNLRVLRRATPADYEKSAYHPEMQKEFTLAEIVQRMGGHGTNHLQQIERLKKTAPR
jgi:uncharacterized damage-inducible protein DinB